jgi:hypothetical protein
VCAGENGEKGRRKKQRRGRGSVKWKREGDVLCCAVRNRGDGRKKKKEERREGVIVEGNPLGREKRERK